MLCMNRTSGIAFLLLLAVAPAAAQQTVDEAHAVPRHGFRSARSPRHLAGAEHGRLGCRGPRRATGRACRARGRSRRRDSLPALGSRTAGGELRESTVRRSRGRLQDGRACPASPTCRTRSRSSRPPRRSRSSTNTSHTVRNIYLDSDHPEGMTDRLWMGDSRGRWEDDTLVGRRGAFHRPDLVRSIRQFPQ